LRQQLDAKAWEPKNPIELVVPAGSGGGSDTLARFFVLIDKHKLSPKPVVVVNKPGGAGTEALMYVKGKKGDPHTILITPNLVFITPLHTGIPFSWKDLSPISLLAEDLFILWVNADSPYMTAKEYIAAAKAKPGELKMGGTAQEDLVVSNLLEQAVGGDLRFNYIPFKGGGEVCANLVGKHVDSTLNNPSECAGHWRGNRVRPLAVLDKSRATFVTGKWGEIPTTREALGIDIEYHMLRAIFGAPGMPRDTVQFYEALMKRLHETPEFQKYLSDNALKGTFLTGPPLVNRLEAADQLPRI
jgi:putative tricarboxylic transport membrane protein